MQPRLWQKENLMVHGMVRASMYGCACIWFICSENRNMGQKVYEINKMHLDVVAVAHANITTLHRHAKFVVGPQALYSDTYMLCVPFVCTGRKAKSCMEMWQWCNGLLRSIFNINWIVEFCIWIRIGFSSRAAMMWSWQKRTASESITWKIDEVD